MDKEQPIMQRKQRKPREKKEAESGLRTQIAEVPSGNKITSDRNQTVGEVERVFTTLTRIYKRMKGGMT